MNDMWKIKRGEKFIIISDMKMCNMLAGILLNNKLKYDMTFRVDARMCMILLFIKWKLHFAGHIWIYIEIK